MNPFLIQLVVLNFEGLHEGKWLILGDHTKNFRDAVFCLQRTIWRTIIPWNAHSKRYLDINKKLPPLAGELTCGMLVLARCIFPCFLFLKSRSHGRFRNHGSMFFTSTCQFFQQWGVFRTLPNISHGVFCENIQQLWVSVF